MSNSLSSEALKLLLSNVFFRAGNSIRRIFLNVYIFKFIGDLKILAIFSLILLAFHLVGFFTSSLLIKKGYRNILSVLSLLGTASIFLIFAYDVGLIQKYYLLFPIFIGGFSGIYWCVYSNNQFDLTVPKNRGNYEGWKKTLRTLNALVTPIIIGAIITYNIGGNGYSFAFIIGGILFSISAYLSIVDESKLKIKDTAFKIRELGVKISHKRDIVLILFILFLLSFALSTNVIEVISPLVLTDTGVSELGIGGFISFISILSMGASYIFGKFVDYKHYKASFLGAGCVYLGLISLLLILPSNFHFNIFITCLALLYIFMDIPTTVFASNYIHEISGYKNLKSEYILIREFSTILGRMLMFVPLFFITSFSLQSLTFLFFSMAFSIFISMILFMYLRIPKTD